MDKFVDWSRYKNEVSVFICAAFRNRFPVVTVDFMGFIIQNLKGVVLEREQLSNGNLLHLLPLLLLPGFLGGENVICPFQRHV